MPSYMGNVKNCGAAGDGKTDDTQAIQRLLDNWPEKCTLYFPAGTYLISAPLKVRAGTNLVGEPAKNGVGGAVIKAAKSMDYLIGAAGAKLCDAVYMNLTLDGGRTNGCKLGSLLDMPGFCSMKLANIKLTNCSGPRRTYLSGHQGRSHLDQYCGKYRGPERGGLRAGDDQLRYRV